MKRTTATNSGPYRHEPKPMTGCARGCACGAAHGARPDHQTRTTKNTGRALFLHATGIRGGMRTALVLCLVLAAGLSACAPREQRSLTFEEQQDVEAYYQCRREATAMNPEWRGDTSYFPWRAYFDMCMRRMGVSKDAMRRMRL